MITKPILVEGGRLEINFSTSAAGSIRWELQDAATGRPIPGCSLAENPEIFGDAVDYDVPLAAGSPLAKAVAGKPVRLRFVLRDADLYSFRFH